MPRQYGFTRVPDTQIVALFQELSDLNPQTVCRVGFLDNLTFSLKAAQAMPPGLKTLINEGTFLIGSASLSLAEAGLNVNFYRGQAFISENGSHAWRPSPNPYLDGLDVQGPNQQINTVAPAVIKVISEFISLAPPADMAAISSESVDRSGAILNRMQAAVSSLGEKTAEITETLAARSIELQREADTALAERLDALEEGFRSREIVLEAERENLKKRLQQIDDSDNTHSRRSLAVNMRTQSDNALQGKFLSRSWRALLGPVGGSVAAFCLLSSLAYQSAIELTNVHTSSVAGNASNSVLYFGELRTVLLGFAAAACLWSALRALNARYRQVSDWENDLHRFRLDTERASFIIEADLETRKINGQALPDVVLDRLSQNLFNSNADGAIRQQDGMANAVSSLLNRPASLKITRDGGEVTLDRKELGKAKKEIDRSSED